MFRPWLVLFLLHISSAVVLHHDDNERLGPNASQAISGRSLVRRESRGAGAGAGAGGALGKTQGPDYIGCYHDASNRDLPHFQGYMTLDKCLEACANYKYYSQQASRECWCGDSYGKHGSSTDCRCDSTEIGAWLNCVYKTPAECAAGTYLYASSSCERCWGETRRRRAYTCSGCAADTYGVAGQDTCETCAGGSLRRRRAWACTPCPAGFWSAAGETCSRCVGGEVRRRRAKSCDACPIREYDSGDTDECQKCSQGEVRRRRATSCEACSITDYSSSSSDDCKAPHE
mmetsp:Transcript_16634/g.35803  ORF Transcript_16634/g.35803 Transcript_16634/m.35803 type:complete len:288 (-) Transcript_16634:100-963(-)